MGEKLATLSPTGASLGIERAMRVLLIEDDVTTKRSVELMLDALGYEYDSAELGEDGLEMAMRETYDLILLDIMLPGMDGYDVIQRLRANQVDTPVLVQSALVDRDFAIQGMSLGVDDYLIKPYSQIELAVRIESALNRACLRNPDDEDEAPEAEPDRQERRRSGRRNVLKTAQIYARNSNRAMESMIINLSDDGAALKPADPPNCPPSFELEISNGVIHHCEVCWRYRNKVGVHFVEA